MADLPDASVDLIFTSPPYEARKVYHTADGDIGRLRGDEFIAALKPDHERVSPGTQAKR